MSINKYTLIFTYPKLTLLHLGPLAPQSAQYLLSSDRIIASNSGAIPDLLEVEAVPILFMMGFQKFLSRENGKKV